MCDCTKDDAHRGDGRQDGALTKALSETIVAPLAERITRREAHAINPTIHADFAEETLGDVAALIRDVGYAIWEANADAANNTVLHDLLRETRHALWAAAAALDYEIEVMEAAARERGRP